MGHWDETSRTVCVGLVVAWGRVDMEGAASRTPGLLNLNSP